MLKVHVMYILHNFNNGAQQNHVGMNNVCKYNKK